MIIRQMLIIKGDTNDADYITETTKLSDAAYAKYLPLIKKVAQAIKNRSHLHENNWPNSQYSHKTFEDLYIDNNILTEEEIETFDQFVPHELEGVHSIRSIRILKYVEDKELL